MKFVARLIKVSRCYPTQQRVAVSKALVRRVVETPLACPTAQSVTAAIPPESRSAAAESKIRSLVFIVAIGLNRERQAGHACAAAPEIKLILDVVRVLRRSDLVPVGEVSPCHRRWLPDASSARHFPDLAGLLMLLLNKDRTGRNVFRDKAEWCALANEVASKGVRVLTVSTRLTEGRRL